LRVGIISVYTDYHRHGRHNRIAMQPQIGALIAGLLPRGIDIEIVNDVWRDPDWDRDYDLLFLSSLHSDFDRARQISHYWRRRGAKTVLGGPLASRFPALCKPYFDAVVIGDPEQSVPQLYADFLDRTLRPYYHARRYDPALVPVPRFDLAFRQQVVPLMLEATRGCPFTCDFCSLTALGTRYHFRPVAAVVRDIREGQHQLAGMVPGYKLKFVAFSDNNLGGHLGYLRELCAALEPLKLRWSACVTFNVASNPELVRLMARAGCYTLFVGLETFNPAALADMNKPQNVIAKTRDMIRLCHRHGVFVFAGLMLSPTVDDHAYMDAIPGLLQECGLRVPTFISLETPFPGTPYFERLARQPGALLPNALLRDFSGYTLTVNPRRLPAAEFIAGYRRVISSTYSLRARLGKLIAEAPRFLAGGHWDAALFCGAQAVTDNYRPDPARTYLAGTDRAPPETVPLTDADFVSASARARVLGPWAVTDRAGAIMPQWLGGAAVYGKRGAVSVSAQSIPRTVNDHAPLPAAAPGQRHGEAAPRHPLPTMAGAADAIASEVPT
jgi:hypothetical protein